MSRAFYSGQYASMAPLFEHYGIQLWTPEVGGRIDEVTGLRHRLAATAGGRE